MQKVKCKAFCLYRDADEDEDDRLADNECYANGNPVGPFHPASKQGEHRRSRCITLHNTKHKRKKNKNTMRAQEITIQDTAN